MSFADDLRGRSLARKLVIWFAGAATALVVLTAALLYVALVQGVAWRDDQVLMKRAATVRDLLRVERIDVDYLDHEVSEDLEGPRQLFMRISGPPAIGLHETPLMPEGLLPDRFPNAAALSADEFHYAAIDDGDGRRYRAVTLRTRAPDAAGGGWVTIQMALDTSLDSEVLTHYAELIVFVVAAGLALSIFVGLWIVRTQLAPLKKMSAEIMAVGHSTLDRRVSLDGLPAELGDVATQFNHMLTRLESAYGSLRRYADDVAHELRTPLNRIQLETEVALRSARTPEEYREALGSTLEECEHLSTMVKALLFIARAENGRTEVSYETLNVAERLEKIRGFFENSAAESGVDLTLECDPALSLNADNTLFQRAVSNLVANSIAHTPQGGVVCLRAAAGEAGVVVDVSDTGEGIAIEHQPYVFDRFFRGDAARRTDKDRVGLGLAITKSIVDLHRGRIALASSPETGTRFSLYFPVA
ncbi:MAG: heavy metal sensor histidine kinase [Alphaproteobacteria bacterium]|nr:heavy metal sensor histidine kinase [Alphaproteobacteria bacterium]